MSTNEVYSFAKQSLLVHLPNLALSAYLSILTFIVLDLGIDLIDSVVGCIDQTILQRGWDVKRLAR